jgi:hypothetical protein
MANSGRIWLKVPDGSTFEASASGTTSNFNINLLIHSDTGPDSTVGRAALVPGPAQLTVHSPHNYNVRVDVNVAGDPPAAVTFTAKVILPGGKPFGPPFVFTTPAVQGTYLATLGIATVIP